MVQAFSLLTVCLSFVISARSIIDSKSLIDQMHARYHGKFNKNITFVQIETTYDENGKPHIKTSYEAFHFPGKLRIDYGAKHSIDGVIYRDDTVYHFKEGKLYKKDLGVNTSLLLSGDIYFLSVHESMERLSKMGYDTQKFREDTYEGKKVYVVGADKSDDLTSKQFWIDAEDLYLVRNIYPGADGTTIEDNRFVEHEIVGKSWVESEVHIYVNNRLVRKEKYAEVKADNDKLDQHIFDHQKWGSVHWHGN